MIDYAALKAEIDAWARGVTMDIRGKAPVLTGVKGKVKTKYGAPTAIAFTFPKHYVFREKGVGKYRGIGSGKETPKPDINPAIANRLKELGEIAANGFAEVVVKNLFIK